MVRRGSTGARALYLLAHAWFASRPGTAVETVACNLQMTRTRDFLIHAPAADVVEAAVSITAAEFEAGRDDALIEMRNRCGACGLCARFGIKPP
jgi:hypothetical protein